MDGTGRNRGSNVALGRRRLLGGLIAASAAAPMGRAFGNGETGLDQTALGQAAERASGLNQLHSLIVARNGELALAERFRGPALDRPTNVKSVSKTIVAALTGAALDREVLSGVDQPIGGLLGDLMPDQADPRARDIKIADLLTMQAGLERTSGPNYGPWVNSPNWVDFALSRRFVAEPGARMLYSTGSYHLLGVCLARASGQSLLTLAGRWLGEPLGIEIPPWTRDPQGYYMGGNNMALSPLALFRFGEMVRLGGVWQDQRVLSEDWVDASWEVRTRSPFSGHSYGYGWFLARTRASERRVAYARGYGGQMLYIVPSLGLTVVVTSDPTRPGRSYGYVGELHRMLAMEIIPAAERA